MPNLLATLLMGIAAAAWVQLPADSEASDVTERLLAGALLNAAALAVWLALREPLASMLTWLLHAATLWPAALLFRQQRLRRGRLQAARMALPTRPGGG